MLLALVGADRLAVRRRRDALVQEYAAGGLDDLALTRLDGSRCTPDDLHTACHAVAFFGGQRVVVVDDLLTRFESKRGGKAAPLADEPPPDGDLAPDDDPAPAPVEAIPPPTPIKGGKRGKTAGGGTLQERQVARFVAELSATPEDAVVILWERSEVRATNPLLQVVKRHGQIEEFKPPASDLALERWIEERAQAQQVRLGAGVAGLLATNVGRDTEVLAAELDKLATYAGPGATITEATVQLLTPQLAQAAAFDLIKAMGRRDAARALSLLRRLLTAGEKTYAIVGLLGWQVRTLLQVQALARQRLSSGRIAERLGISEYAVRQTQESLPFYTGEGLQALHRHLLAVDQEIKTGGGDGEAALELLVLEMSKRSGDRR